jgi:hypothetical protein
MMVSVLDTLLWQPVAMPQPNEFVEITTVGPEGWERGVPVAAASRIIRADLPVGGWCAFDRNWFVTRVDGQLMPAGGALILPSSSGHGYHGRSFWHPHPHLHLLRPAG